MVWINTRFRTVPWRRLVSVVVAVLLCSSLVLRSNSIFINTKVESRTIMLPKYVFSPAVGRTWMCSVRYMTDGRTNIGVFAGNSCRTHDFLQQFADRRRLATNQTYFVAATDRMTSGAESPSHFLWSYVPAVFCLTVTSEANDNDDRYDNENGAWECMVWDWKNWPTRMLLFMGESLPVL